ncbi:MAG: hypothetical protein ACYCU7_16205 [Acidimicrobiales bacterium]
MSGPALGRCLYCGRPAQELHHFTASLAGRTDHLDPQATIPLCVPCHKAEHAAWRTPAVGLAQVDHPLVARLGRTTWTLGRLADAGRPLEAGVIVVLHGVLVTVSRDFDELMVASGARR